MKWGKCVNHLHNAWQVVGTQAINSSFHIASEHPGKDLLNLLVVRGLGPQDSWCEFSSPQAERAMLLCNPTLCLKFPHQYAVFWGFFVCLFLFYKDWLLQSQCICLNSKLDCHFFSDYAKTQKLMLTYCWKLLGIFLSFTQRNADQCTHVMARVKPAVCSFVWVQLEWRKLPLPEMVAFMWYTLSGELSAMHNLQPCPWEQKAAAKLFLQKHVSDSSALHMRVRCGWLGVW